MSVISRQPTRPTWPRLLTLCFNVFLTNKVPNFRHVPSHHLLLSRLPPLQLMKLSTACGETDLQSREAAMRTQMQDVMASMLRTNNGNSNNNNNDNDRRRNRNNDRNSNGNNYGQNNSNNNGYAFQARDVAGTLLVHCLHFCK
jgi:hypothetical protein